MSQNSLVLPTTGTLPGLTAVQNINNALDSLCTSNAGGAAPTNSQSGAPETGQLWMDSTTSPATLRVYNGSSWLPVSSTNYFMALATATPGMTVTLLPGVYFDGTNADSVAAQTVTIATAPSSPNNRIDRICLNAYTGTYTYVQGSAAATPTAPAVPVSCIPCCQVYVASGVSAITNAAITDERVGSAAISAPQYGTTLQLASAYMFSNDTTDLQIQANGSANILHLKNASSGNVNGFQMLGGATGTAPILSATGSDTNIDLDLTAKGTGRIVATSALVPQAGLAGYDCGFKNKFRNPQMTVIQRGTSGTIASGASAYTTDGWIVGAAGATLSWQAAGALGTGTTVYYGALLLTGNSGMTDTYVKQRIEGELCGNLDSQQVTFQCFCFNNSGAAITPTLTVKHCTAVNQFSSLTTDINAQSLQTIASGGLGVVSYSFTTNLNAYLGMEITLDLGAALNANTKYIYLSGFDLRVTPGVPTGLVSAPPTPELRPLMLELELCQRYYTTSYDNGTPPGSATTSGLVGGLGSTTGTSNLISLSLPVAMRAAPTILYYDSSGNASKVSTFSSGAFTANQSTSGTMPLVASTKAIDWYLGLSTAAFFHFTASAEL